MDKWKNRIFWGCGYLTLALTALHLLLCALLGDWREMLDQALLFSWVAAGLSWCRELESLRRSVEWGE